MKSIILFLSIVVSLTCRAEMLTVHGAIDNYLMVAVSGPKLPCNPYVSYWIGSADPASSWYWGATWSWPYDQTSPPIIDSGEYFIINDCSFGEGNLPYYTNQQFGWTESHSIEITPDVRQCEWNLADPMGGYFMWIGDLFPSMTGEYWVDFNPDCTGRVSTVKPTDFGKWAWDGSINPSWVEPVSLKVKGHKKH